MTRLLLILTAVVSIHLAVDAEDPSDLATAAEKIDRLLADAWDRHGIVPAPKSADAEFCRRVWLDLAGVAPPVSEARAFLSDDRGDKREALIDHVLQLPQHARHMATRWRSILLPSDLGDASNNDVFALDRWLRKQFLRNVSYDHFVRAFLTAGGNQNSGAAIFYTSHSLQPEKLAATTSRIFMGIQLQCAQCHDHPFDRWTQDDFWSYAAFFGQLDAREDRMTRSTLIVDRPVGEVTLPDSGRVASPMYPGIGEPPEEDPANNRRRQLTIWMASRDNPYFARAAVNRAWDQLFARGLVDPVDAMDKDNRPSHPELLAYLSDYFVANRFDLRILYATITRTKAYGLSSQVIGRGRPPPQSFAAMTVKTLAAAQFYDSFQQNVLLRPIAADADRRPTPDTARRLQFLQRMKTDGSRARDYPHGVVQALALMNGLEIGEATSPTQSGLFAALDAPFLSDNDRIEILFLATLSRLPSETETNKCRAMLADAETRTDRQKAFSDLLWVLLNTAECFVCP